MFSLVELIRKKKYIKAELKTKLILHKYNTFSVTPLNILSKLSEKFDFLLKWNKKSEKLI